MKLKRLVPRMIIGATMAAMMAVPVSASNINSGSTPPPIEFTKISSTNADSNSGDDSGKVYDFKDPKTSGVVTVTKNWDDSSSNDKRPVPDVSISTEKPGKNPLGYTITYHGNGLTFDNGSTENEIIVNSSGKIVSGQYKLPGNTSVTWYSDSQCTSKVETDNNGLPITGIFSDLDLYAKPKTFIIKGSVSMFSNEFNDLIPDTATSVVFTDEIMPASATLIDVDADGDEGVVAWMDGETMKVSSQVSGQKVVAASDSSFMFAQKESLSLINFSNLDFYNVTNMDSMFFAASGLTSLDLTPLNTSNVTNMSDVFSNCINLTNLDLSSFKTNKVTDMSGLFYHCPSLTSLKVSTLNTNNVINMKQMFYGCKKLTELDLSSFDTSNVTNMYRMFSGCSSLTNLDLSPLDTSKVTDMSFMFENCSGLIGLNLSNLNTDNVTTMYSMFKSCKNIANLDLSSFNTCKVTNMDSMFYDCPGLTSLTLSSFNTDNVTNMRDMFWNCSGIVSLNLSSFNTEKVTDMGYMFERCYGLTNISLGDKFSFADYYYLPSGTWYASDGTAYTSDGTTCTIPNNKADTYTRK